MAITLERFIELAEASGLVIAGELEGLFVELPENQRPQTARQAAEHLIRIDRLTKFQAASLFQGRYENLIVGAYEILDRIGSGGNGIVLRGRHRRMKRTVAVKLLPAALTNSKRAVDRFHHEVRIAGQLAHPNIVGAYDAGQQGQHHYLVMEYVDGKNLSWLVQKHGPLAVESARRCLLQAARGLAYAHRCGIVHRDIKPANLLVDRTGTLKILDMGLARMTDTTTEAQEKAAALDLTHEGQILGTFSYMAPEQAADTHSADARSDIYSLGCTLHYLLLGQSVYGGDTVVQKIVGHREKPIPSLCALRSDVPESLDRLFQRMIAKSPDERPQTTEEVVRLLEESIAGNDSEGGSVEEVSQRLAALADEAQTLAPGDFLESLDEGTWETPSGTSVTARVVAARSGRLRRSLLLRVLIWVSLLAGGVVVGLYLAM